MRSTQLSYIKCLKNGELTFLIRFVRETFTGINNWGLRNDVSNWQGYDGEVMKKFCEILQTQLSPGNLLTHVYSVNWYQNLWKVYIYHISLWSSQKYKRVLPRVTLRKYNSIIRIISFIFMVDIDDPLLCIISIFKIFIIASGKQWYAPLAVSLFS